MRSLNRAAGSLLPPLSGAGDGPAGAWALAPAVTDSGGRTAIRRTVLVCKSVEWLLEKFPGPRVQDQNNTPHKKSNFEFLIVNFKFKSFFITHHSELRSLLYLYPQLLELLRINR